MSEPTIEDVLKAFDQLRNDAIPLPDTMWIRADCMKYLRVSESQFRRISANPDFPAPAKFPVGGDSYSQPRYFADEVIEFSKRPEFRQLSRAS